ncbi:MAG: cbb3-type cytochrome oxidase assembly protein CcoS [Planctomycetota bacterium]|nr:MAG: cbb3-type cytochrome oxidase assembly protein CcoS [Planctomycetota bacterium]
MSVLFILIPAALVLGIAALVGFILCLRSGQYDDLDTPPVRMLFDDEPNNRPSDH